MKEYTITAIGGGVVLSIGAYCDTLGPEIFRVYYCGIDTGRRYAKIGNAARYLEKTSKNWSNLELVKGTIKDIPARGSDWNVAVFRRDYCGGPGPWGRG